MSLTPLRLVFYCGRNRSFLTTLAAKNKMFHYKQLIPSKSKVVTEAEKRDIDELDFLSALHAKGLAPNEARREDVADHTKKRKQHPSQFLHAHHPLASYY